MHIETQCNRGLWAIIDPSAIKSVINRARSQIILLVAGSEMDLSATDTQIFAFKIKVREVLF